MFIIVITVMSMVGDSGSVVASATEPARTTTSMQPTKQPTKQPTTLPTHPPTNQPTNQPTNHHQSFEPDSGMETASKIHCAASKVRDRIINKICMLFEAVMIEIDFHVPRPPLPPAPP